jgi:hypothetical protein
MTILKKLFSILSSNYDQKAEFSQEELNAYHESGHIHLAYLSGFQCENVTLLQDGSQNAFAKFHYGDKAISSLIVAITHFKEDPEMYYMLPYDLKLQTELAAAKITGTLLAGSVAEHLYKSGSDYVGELKMEISGPDLARVSSVHELLNSLDPQNHNLDYIAWEFKKIAGFFQQEMVWNSIDKLAKAILSSTSKSLSQSQIERSLHESGYMNFINHTEGNSA